MLPVEQWTSDWISNENWTNPLSYELASGVSGTYTYCVTSVQSFLTLYTKLQPCYGGAEQALVPPPPLRHREDNRPPAPTEHTARSHGT